ncbi:MAG: hypothetical protein Q8R81_02945 [Novosphingobium sp.]|uniref:hypothetical protein n=1 Tax=Novosphingobium sp. TaxID=1874826 RepID=UPI002737231B|nr:hypothetical protein [Novosphingobium sp.]MDP3549333.1 hypothetical protein [Novosphingobium sp.]
MKQRYTREEFYELVWSKPLTHLAKDFSLSDVALHKICRKHDIPNPPLGWWAKHAAGHKVKRTPLPKLKSGISDTVVIAGGELRREPDEIASAREQARIRASEVEVAADAPAHPIVTKSIAKLRTAKPSPFGLVSVSQHGLIAIEIASASIDRIETCLNRIVAAARLQGFELSGKGERAAFTDGVVTIPFSLKEAVKRSKHVPTEQELADEEKRRKQRDRRWARNSLDSIVGFTFSNPWPEWDHSPTGQVAFEMDVYLRYSSQIRRSFKDAKIQRLENMAADIAVAIAVLGAAMREDDRKAEEARLREEEATRRRIEAKRRAYIEDRRSKVLGEVFARLERRDQLRLVISQLTAELGHDDSARTVEFVRWARDVLERAEQRMSVAGLEALFETEHVFGEDDDRGFYPSVGGW